jgi:hypothetical protein
MTAAEAPRPYMRQHAAVQSGPKIDGDYFTIEQREDESCWALTIWQRGVVTDALSFGSRGEAFRYCERLTDAGMAGITLGVAR